MLARTTPGDYEVRANMPPEARPGLADARDARLISGVEGMVGGHGHGRAAMPGQPADLAAGPKAGIGCINVPIHLHCRVGKGEGRGMAGLWSGPMGRSGRQTRFARWGEKCFV